MRKYRYVFIVLTVMLLILVSACTEGDVDVAPAATPDTVVQPPLPEETPTLPP